MISFIIISVVSVILLVFSYCFYKTPVKGCPRIVYKKLLYAIRRKYYPTLIGYSLTKKQILKIKSLLSNSERDNNFFRYTILPRYEGDLSDIS